jgi:hypothetical protein
MKLHIDDYLIIFYFLKTMNKYHNQFCKSNITLKTSMINHVDLFKTKQLQLHQVLLCMLLF